MNIKFDNNQYGALIMAFNFKTLTNTLNTLKYVTEVCNACKCNAACSYVDNNTLMNINKFAYITYNEEAHNMLRDLLNKNGYGTDEVKNIEYIKD